MKLYKLLITGNDKEFKIEYNFSTNFVNYIDFEFNGTEQEKYNKFLENLKVNSGDLPINVKVKMTTQTTDRAFSKNEILNINDVNDFIKRIGR